MRPFFIVGTDTGVGKTHFALRYIAYRHSLGGSAVVYKPFASGVEFHTGIGLVNGDVLALARAAGKRPKEVNYITFQNPLAPASAAEIEKRPINFDEALHWCRARISDDAAFEGIGGVLVPLTEARNALDFVAELGLPMVIVSRMGLGTINHTMLTMESLRAARLSVAMVVISLEAPLINEAGESGFSFLTRHLSPLPVRILPHLDSAAKTEINESLLFAELEDRLSRMS